MNKNVIIAGAAAGGIFLLFVVVLVFAMSSGNKKVDSSMADGFAQQCLDKSTGSWESRQLIADQLAEIKGPAAVEAMRNVLKNSDEWPVQVSVMRGLAANKDLQSVPDLFKIMEREITATDDSIIEGEKEFRNEAHIAAKKITGVDHDWKVEYDHDDRKERMGRYWNDYNHLKKLKDEAAGGGGP